MISKDCSHYRALISSFLDQELEERNRAELEQHIAGCSVCRHDLFEERLLLSRFNNEDMLFKAPDDLQSRVKSALLEKEKDFSSKQMRLGLRATAAILAIALIATFVWKMQER